MAIVCIILSILWFIVKAAYRFIAILIDFEVAMLLILFWSFTILFGSLRSKVGDPIGAMFRRMGHHFKALFDKEEYHPLNSDGTWDMRFKVNKLISSYL